ncbi:MAG: hypothetical protein Q8P72_02410 [Candidatus Roizmanbacteria bacterium]|uniref:Ribbon-helix-helix protein CopG domain-containing protein n=2 Tax=Candidatus Roizmaniibacteriota TaxID=1752723 RepID=A0A2M8F055_9BACT|nr:hypothetical protein [Candidatus Roizmanbacteria bacterium]PIZ63995.1 MAG: hypothetical protein COY15_06040 [Candidatus Roizmanbacteria bacterium CG_4_10_14_0_2_um_filter_39_12]PJC32693.1 MAG: hypothetical protein CO051_02710 [Candidatus Roizmanbacteria bacterium CG_4_9_14_0_2_um_filter_39_13]PJE61802.1 MAG: hypothetical protein COU87_02645 [Candidatus Roizmanbacteria bacterium CG10_big_fil_rev_8_21_14_0_10_39_12]
MTSDLQQIKQDTRYSQRTQISLSPSMREYIDKQRRSTDESLSEYIRNAITIRVENESISDEKRIEAAKKFFGAGKNTNNPNWNTPEKIRNWQRILRKDKP